MISIVRKIKKIIYIYRLVMYRRSPQSLPETFFSRRLYGTGNKLTSVRHATGGGGAATVIIFAGHY